MTTEVVQVPDEVLELAAGVMGADSVEAEILAKLKIDRAQDRQVYAFRVGDWWVTCPVPDTKTELALIEIAEGLTALEQG